MADAYTTLRVKKTTRDLINGIASGKGISADELLNLLTKTTKDAIKQILIEVDKEKYYTMRDLAQQLHRMKLVGSPKVEDVFLLAMDNLIRGLDKSWKEAQTSQPSQLTDSPGQTNDTPTGHAMGAERR
jgi:hypothetical protein